jgi:ribosome-associated toxin RatA of RatAB toxin-antitoxin module
VPGAYRDRQREEDEVAEQATEHTTVSASPERCFAVVTDIERYPEWAADIKLVTVDERDDQGRPLACTFRAAAFGRSTSYTLVYDYSEAPHVLAWRLTRGDITTKLDGRYVFDAAEGGGTDITYHLEVELRVPIPGFIKMRAASRIMSTALRELKARVESDG